MATATPSDVRLEIDTELSDSEISDLIDRVSRDIDRQSSQPDDGTDDRRDLEAVLTAYRIVTSRDRKASSVSSGNSRVDWEADITEELRDRAEFLGASDDLLGGEEYSNYDVF